MIVGKCYKSKVLRRLQDVREELVLAENSRKKVLPIMVARTQVSGMEVGVVRPWRSRIQSLEPQVSELVSLRTWEQLWG